MTQDMGAPTDGLSSCGSSRQGVSPVPASIPSAADLRLARLERGFRALPRDIEDIMSWLGDEEACFPASYVATETGASVERVRAVHRALKTLGLAHFGTLCDVDAEAYTPCGSGYWISAAGTCFYDALETASGIEARSDETQSGSAVGESPSDAQPISGSNSNDPA